MAKKQEQTGALTVPKDTVISIPDCGEQIQKWTKQVEKYEADSVQLSVTDQKTEATAIDMGKAVKDLHDEAEAMRKALVAPPKEVLKRIDSTFGFITDRAESIIKVVKEKILAHRAEEQKKLQAKQEQANKRAEKSGKPARQIDQTQSNQVIGNNAAAQIQKRWTYEVENQAALPDQFLMPNDKAIKSAIAAGVRKIQGLKIFQKDNISIG